MTGNRRLAASDEGFLGAKGARLGYDLADFHDGVPEPCRGIFTGYPVPANRRVDRVHLVRQTLPLAIQTTKLLSGIDTNVSRAKALRVERTVLVS